MSVVNTEHWNHEQFWQMMSPSKVKMPSELENALTNSFGSIEKLNEIQSAFKRNHALQCGFCTPGFLITIKELLETEKLETEEEIRKGLSGNLCRCTGYENIVKAVQELVEKRKIT